MFMTHCICCFQGDRSLIALTDFTLTHRIISQCELKTVVLGSNGEPALTALLIIDLVFVIVEMLFYFPIYEVDMKDALCVR